MYADSLITYNVFKEILLYYLGYCGSIVGSSYGSLQSDGNGEWPGSCADGRERS